MFDLLVIYIVILTNGSYIKFYLNFQIFIIVSVFGNLPPIFTEDMNNLALSEATPVGWVVYKLEGYDPEGGEVTFGLIGSENFAVDSKTGEVKVTKALDREVSTLECSKF